MNADDNNAPGPDADRRLPGPDSDNNVPEPEVDRGVQKSEDGGSDEVPAEDSWRRRETRPGRSLLQAARLLPLATIATWIVTIFVPILDSGGTEGIGITITSLGEAPLGTRGTDPGLVAIWILIVIIALLPWLFGHSHWWSAAAILIGIVIIFGLVAVAITPPSLIWDGQTAEGVPTGGMEIARPDVGFVLWIIGSLALIAAGICGWIGVQRLKSGDRNDCGRA